MAGVFLASFILMGIFLLPYFAYIFGRDIPFSRTTLDIGNLLWPLAIFAVLFYEDKKEKLGIWRNPSLGIGSPLAAHYSSADLPGKPYIDYMVRNTDGKLVPISTLIQGKVALIDLWASWCGPCRRHSIAMIPVYEKYKDKGFTVIAIARERNRQAMENAAKKDGYPWPSLLELNDENQVWRKNGADNAGGAMYLIDRDGTILSTSTDAEELEPIIKKALNIE